MYRLLIVDDVNMIVDGLYDLFQGNEHLEIEIFKAYSGQEALDILFRTKIDIVLTDINMPNMTGIDLLKEIHVMWPLCKVIFLTSYDDFQYAKEAISLGGFGYLLKIEGDEKIVSLVEKAIKTLDKEMELESLYSRAEFQYNLAKPTLQKELLLDLIEGKQMDAASLTEAFMKVDMPLQAGTPFLYIIGRIDGWKKARSNFEKKLFIFATNNIVEEYLSHSVQMMTIVYEKTKMVWFMQPNLKAVSGEEQPLERISRFVYGTLESIQDSCRKFLGLEISFLLSGATQWSEMSDKFQVLQTLLSRGIGLNKEILVSDDELQTNERSQDEPSVLSMNHAKLGYGKFNLLANTLSNGNKTEFMHQFHLLMDIVSKESSLGRNSIQLEAYHHLSSLFLSYLNRLNLKTEIEKKAAIDNLYFFDDSKPWNYYMEYFAKLADHIFEHNDLELQEKTGKIVTEIRQYVSNHLAEDISLTKLGEHVHLNPNYLSRLYKQMSGVSLSDHIAEVRTNKAIELLTDSHLKIHEIAHALGYNSGIAFTRFFKKIMNQTPQEFRDSIS